MHHTTTNEADFRKLLGLPARSIGQVESEMDRKPHLAGDLRHERQAGAIETRDARQARTAAAALGRIPAADEALHLAISGRFALWHFVEAGLALAGCKIDTLHIATLGFSSANLRSCKNIEQASIFGDPRLYDFHRGWIDDLFERPGYEHPAAR